MKTRLIPLIFLLIVGCQQKNPVEYSPRPTAPSTVPELIDSLSSGDDQASIVAAYALASMGAEAAPAVPALIDNLTYEGHTDVRESAAYALGKIGADASAAVPTLVSLMHDNSESVHVRSAAALAIGGIGEITAVPELINTLYVDGLFVNSSMRNIAIDAVRSIEHMTDQEFSGRTGTGYLIGQDGVPIIVLEARKWWEEEGQYLDWSD